ncbi:unnamed protein product [Haemonchus placei]|uniref:Zf-ISL3 domain-containing protein n=1 Tax=Haemonchus placei TaxID=6290 RepID=A0A158QM65_HAEPC|nr:unnamed protein product [Haemonchus placei]
MTTLMLPHFQAVAQGFVRAVKETFHFPLECYGNCCATCREEVRRVRHAVWVQGTTDDFQLKWTLP